MKVFVSSTKGDLDPDCRPRVLEAISFVEAIPIAMENWPAEYVPALELVLQKIDESTHYVGLFAYRRGWTPPGSTESITEQEFEHARARLGGERIAVFVPEDSSEIAQVLLDRAKNAQDLADTEAQIRFLKRVTSAGTVEFFRDVPQLSMRAVRRVMSWKRPLVGPEDEREPQPPKIAITERAGDQAARIPTTEQIAELGRRPQMDVFETHVVTPLVAGTAAAAAVLISGLPGFGQEQLLKRLEDRFEKSSRRMHLCPIGWPQWRRNDLKGLLSLLGKGTGAPELPTVAAAAAHLEAQLAQKDVVLRVGALHNFDSGVRGFAEQFWQPLVDALPASTPYRLLCIATHESADGAPRAVEPAVQPAPGDPFDPRRLVLLPPLEAFTAQELAVFVRPWFDDPDVSPLVDDLMRATRGVPHQLFDALADPSTWASEG